MSRSLTPDPLLDKRKQKIQTGTDGSNHGILNRSTSPTETTINTNPVDRPRKGILSNVPASQLRPSSRDVSYLTEDRPRTEESSPSAIPLDDHILEKVDPFMEYDPRDLVYKDGQRYVRVFPSRRPTGRADAIHLASWFDRSLSKLSKKDDEYEDPFALDAILIRTIDEINRQVSVQCIERGVVLKKAWVIQKNLCSRLLSLNKALADDKQNLGKKAKDLESMNASLERQIENLVASLEKKDQEVQLTENLMRRREMDFLKKQVSMKSEIDSLEKKEKELVKTNEEKLASEKRRIELEAELAIEEMEKKLQDLVDELQEAKIALGKSAYE